MSSALDDILVRITGAARERLAREPAPPDLERRALESTGARRRGGARSLAASLARPGVRVIAECKHRSPSAGWLRQPFDPVELARTYEAHGAAGISVVTEPEFFAGRAAWVPAVRAQVSLPVLQKDFLFSRRQLQEVALLGSDAVLLMARILPGALLAEMLALAGELAIEVVLEVHDADDLERALAVPAPIIGVNARDLKSFSVDLDAAARLAEAVPPDRIAIVESGIRGPADVARLTKRGLPRFLVGENLLRAEEPGAALEGLIACR